jgi:hypothetical protein
VSYPPRTAFQAIDPRILERATRRTAYQNPRYDRMTPVRLRVLQQLVDGVARQAREVETNSPETLARLVNLGLLDKFRAEDRLRQPWVYAITETGKAAVERVAEIERRRAAITRRRAARAPEPGLVPAT